MSVEFQSLLGAFQGDCLSWCLFTLVLAGALFDLKNQIVVEIDREKVGKASLGGLV